MGFPDVCNTPVGVATAPIPYPNIASNAQALGFSMTVKVSGVNALNQMSKIPMTSGDEGGVAHATIKGSASYTMGNPLVNIDKSPAINLACPGTGNNNNCPLNAVAVPSAVNVMYCLRSEADSDDSGPSRVKAEQELLAIGDEMTRPALDSVQELPGGVLQVGVGRIAPGVTSELFAALSSRPNTAALIVDLRDNPGGTLEAATQLCSFFLPEGSVIAHLSEPDEEATTLRCSEAPSCTLPLVVLTNDNTASAAELVAASLQDNRRALIVGTRSYGKTWAYRFVPGLAERFHALHWQRPSRSASAETQPGAQLERVVPDVPASGAAAERQAWALALELARAEPG